MSINFEKILPNEEQIYKLYMLLQNRKYKISHKFSPSFEEHKTFVHQNPYLVWYLINKNNTLIGSVYLNNDNSIGINLINKSLIILI